MESRYTWKNQLLMGLRNFAFAGGIIVLLVYLILVSGEAARKELEDLLVEEKDTVTTIEEPIAYGYEDGAKIWELRSQVAEQEAETESSELTRIYELILFKGGEENVLIRGDRGDWDKPREKLTLTGNVVVESGDGTTLLATERLIWEERTKVLSCPEFVDFWVEDNHILANSLYSDDDLASIDFVGEVIMFVIGLEGENFVTREGDFPVEDIDEEDKGDGMNILAEYVHYDKGDRICRCFPFIPLRVQNLHGLDSDGNYIEEETETIYQMSERLLDPEYIEALQQSVSQMDLTQEEIDFLEGRRDSLPVEAPQPTGPVTGVPTDAPEFDISAGQTDISSGPSAGSPPVMGGRTSPMGISGPEGLSGGRLSLGDDLTTGEISGPVASREPTPIDLPELRVSDPEIILSAPDYSDITDWEISEDLYAEKYEADADFDPFAEEREGLVFCYKGEKKFWCEELYIDLADHRLEALRQADARFRDLKRGSDEPAEGRAARAIQESPTQFIGNYLIHNWETDITEGYGRVLVIQPQKDVEAESVIYYEEADVVHAWGDVIVHQFSGEWWETSGAIEDIESERARESVRNPTVVTTDALLSYNNRIHWGFGNVVFRQEEQTVKGERVQYEEETEILVMAGNVEYQNEDGEQLYCQLLTMDMFLDEYIAEGAAVARNIVPEEYRENLAEFQDDEDTKPEDDARTRLLENRTAAGLGDWSDEIAHPPPPPIEVLPQIGGNEEAGERLGPEIPSGGFSSSEETDMETVLTAPGGEMSVGDIPLMEESNTGNVVPGDIPVTGTGMMPPSEDEPSVDSSVYEPDLTGTEASGEEEITSDDDSTGEEENEDESEEEEEGSEDSEDDESSEEENDHTDGTGVTEDVTQL